MIHALYQPNPDVEIERKLLEAAVAKAGLDQRPSVPHDQMRADALREIERLERKIAKH